ncbi:MAG: glycosyltransferase family 1 protein [Candidatus Brocadiia bacterium]|jgi:glycosyltransferase involved in cell wall biosynthesis
MKIGLDIPEFSPARNSGIERYTRNLLCALHRNAGPHELSLYLCRPPGWAEKDTLPSLAQLLPGVPVHVLFDGLVPHFPGELNTARRLRLSGALAPVDGVLRRLYRRFNRSTAPWVSPLRRACAEARAVEAPDVLHHLVYVHYPFRRGPSLATIYDLVPLLFPQWLPEEVRAALRPTFRFARRCAAVIAISENTRQDLHRRMRVPLDRIHVVPLAADEVFAPAPDPARVRERLAPLGLADRPFLLYAGTLEPRKNVPGLIRAYARLRSQSPESAPLLVLAGTKGWGYEPIFQEIERLGLANEARHLDAPDDAALAALMNAALALVYPSFYEGFGLPPLEAMACGCPVITSNNSSLPEVVGDAAIQVDPRDEPALAQAMQAVITRPELRASLRERGLARARLFSWDRVARETLNVYARVAPSGRHS